MTSAGAFLRDEGIERVRRNNDIWTEVALGRVEKLSLENPHTRLTGEDIRMILSDKGLPSPKSPNAWGSLINIAIKRRLIRPTGLYQPTNDPRSHACQKPIHEMVAHLRDV
jgi:hypothetical protein